MGSVVPVITSYKHTYKELYFFIINTYGRVEFNIYNEGRDLRPKASVMAWRLLERQLDLPPKAQNLSVRNATEWSSIKS